MGGKAKKPLGRVINWFRRPAAPRRGPPPPKPPSFGPHKRGQEKAEDAYFHSWAETKGNCAKLRKVQALVAGQKRYEQITARGRPASVQLRYLKALMAAEKASLRKAGRSLLRSAAALRAFHHSWKATAPKFWFR